jgi:hypothetical protein
MTALEEIKSFFWRTKEKPKAEEPKPTPEAAKKETPPGKKAQGVTTLFHHCRERYI